MAVSSYSDEAPPAVLVWVAGKILQRLFHFLKSQADVLDIYVRRRICCRMIEKRHLKLNVIYTAVPLNFTSFQKNKR